MSGDVKRIALAPGTYFYPHADRVIFREGSPHPDMSWPLPLRDDAAALVQEFAANDAEPALRSALFALMAVDSAYAQMALRDGRAKRDHVCAMLKKAARAALRPEETPT